MKWLSKLTRRSNSREAAEQHKKSTVREIQKGMARLRDEYKKVELRPCRGDADLRQRENELGILKSRIYALEKQRDKYLYTWASEA